MKKSFLAIILVVILLLTISCSSPSEEMTQIGNPWIEYDSLSDAEDAIGFTLDMPVEISGGFIAEEFRVMNNVLLEVVYRDKEYEVIVRKAEGEDQDISGVYEDPESSGASLQLYSHNGYSYSLYAPNGYWGDSAHDFDRAILDYSP